MPKNTALTQDEKIIKTFYSYKKSHREIARLVGRSQKVVFTFLKNSKLYNTKKKRGINKKLFSSDKRRICRIASNSCKSSRQIAEEMSLTVTPRRVRQVINSQEHF